PPFNICWQLKREANMAVAIRAGPFRGTQAGEAGGAATESMGGGAALVPDILALTGGVPPGLTSIRGIVVGETLLVEGAAIAARQSNILAQAAGTTTEPVEIGGGVTVELMGGLAAVILGVLALIGIFPAEMLAALVLTGGAALILSAGTVQRLNELQASLA